MTDEINVKTDRNSRSAETRDSQTRRTPWKPPSMLDAPEAPPGYQFRWIREATEDKMINLICLNVLEKDMSL